MYFFVFFRCLEILIIGQLFKIWVIINNIWEIDNVLDIVYECLFMLYFKEEVSLK